MTNTIDKHQFKITIGVFIAIVLFVITASIQFATWKTTIENEISRINDEKILIDKDLEKCNMRMESFESEYIEVKIDLAKIKTQLHNIESLLIEIKQDIK